MKSQLPCRATVIAFKSEPSYKCIKRSFDCGYGAQKIADRWMKKGYDRVSVQLTSTSTGKRLETITVTAPLR